MVIKVPSTGFTENKAVLFTSSELRPKVCWLCNS